jgi:hypothetical protein
MRYLIAILISLTLTSPTLADYVAFRVVCQNVHYQPKDNTKDVIVRTEIELVRAEDGLTFTDFRVTHYTTLGNKYVRSEQYEYPEFTERPDDGTRPNKFPVTWTGYRLDKGGQDWQMTGEFLDDGFGHFSYTERLWKWAANPRNNRLVMSITETCH